MQPHQLAIDRPSPKFLGFLRKHYALSAFKPQANNFVVFQDYWTGGRRASTAAKPSAAAPTAPTALPQPPLLQLQLQPQRWQPLAAARYATIPPVGAAALLPSVPPITAHPAALAAPGNNAAVYAQFGRAVHDVRRRDLTTPPQHRRVLPAQPQQQQQQQPLPLAAAARPFSDGPMAARGVSANRGRLAVARGGMPW